MRSEPRLVLLMKIIGMTSWITMDVVAKTRPLYVEGKSHKHPSNGRVVLLTNISVCRGRIRYVDGISSHLDKVNINVHIKHLLLFPHLTGILASICGINKSRDRVE